MLWKILVLSHLAAVSALLCPSDETQRAECEALRPLLVFPYKDPEFRMRYVTVVAEGLERPDRLAAVERWKRLLGLSDADLRAWFPARGRDDGPGEYLYSLQDGRETTAWLDRGDWPAGAENLFRTYATAGATPLTRGPSSAALQSSPTFRCLALEALAHPPPPCGRPSLF